MANEVGKKFFCTVCGSEFIVTRGGNCELACCNKPLEEKKKEVKKSPEEKQNG